MLLFYSGLIALGKLANRTDTGINQANLYTKCEPRVFKPKRSSKTNPANNRLNNSCCSMSQLNPILNYHANSLLLIIFPVINDFFKLVYILLRELLRFSEATYQRGNTTTKKALYEVLTLL